MCLSINASASAYSKRTRLVVITQIADEFRAGQITREPKKETVAEPRL
jgi:hypothetical protein